jgi:hypothetical protein
MLSNPTVIPLLFLKGDPARLRPPGTRKKRNARRKPPRIRCPACGWEPGRDDRWMCACLHSWNTFDTRGVCPECARRWTETQCPKCHAWSKHEDWYA